MTGIALTAMFAGWLAWVQWAEIVFRHVKLHRVCWALVDDECDDLLIKSSRQLDRDFWRLCRLTGEVAVGVYVMGEILK
jgi:hypothetical protein